MKKNILFTLSFFLIYSSFAQNNVGGEFSIGPRLGGSAGLSFKFHNKSNRSAIEFITANSFDNKIDGFTIGAMFEKLAPLNGDSRLNAIAGTGVNFNFKGLTKVGVSGILGFDWRLKSAPLTLQLDWLPTLFFINVKSTFNAVNALSPPDMSSIEKNNDIC